MGRTGIIRGMWVLMICLLGRPVYGLDRAEQNLTPVQQKLGQLVTINFRETVIDDALMIMARQAKIDIVKSPKVEGKVTAALTDIPLEEALTNILDVHGYAYLATENMIRIIPKEEVYELREKVISRVYKVTYADVVEVENALRKFISDQGAISANPGTSNIIVSDLESRIKAIDAFIQEIDQITPQILVEAKVYDIFSKDRMDLGVEWQMGTQTAYLDGDELFVNGAPLRNVGNAGAGKTDPHLTSGFLGATAKATDTNGFLRFGISNDNVRLDAILRAQLEDVRAKLLASPRILVLNNQLAIIKIVEEIPYQELTQSSAGGSIGTTTFRDVGVELRVTPHLTRDGLIRLLLNPKFSMRTGDVVIAGVANPIPQPIIATRETMTTALIRDGQTVVIGGLKKQDVSQQTNKIPLLGDLPLVGGIFRFEGESTVNSELVVFITPHLIREPTLTEDEQFHLSQTTFTRPNIPEPRIRPNLSR